MTNVSIGDMAAFYRSNISNSRVKQELQRLGNELASGTSSDLRAATGGDLGNYAGIDTTLKLLAAHKTAAAEAGLFVDTIQRSLETVQNTTSELGPALLLAASSQEATLVQSASSDARARFATVVSVLNTQVADRSILAGNAIGGLALADAETMLADLQAAIATQTTAAGVEAAVTAWFDAPAGGFETSGYLGSTASLAAMRIGPDEEVSVDIRADDQRLRDLLKGYAMAALVADGALSGLHEERVALTETAANQLLASDRQLTEIRTDIGTAEQRIDTARTRNSAETAALEIARNDIVAVDPYQTATDLQAAETRLETLYAITARLSRLHLSEYLR